MEELLKKLRRADEICKDANVHYENASAMEQETYNEPSMKKKAKIKWAVIGFLVYMILGQVVGLFIGILEKIPGLGLVLIPIINIGWLLLVIFVSVMCYRKEKNFIDKKMEVLRAQINEEDLKAQEIFEEHAEELSFLPVDYWYPMATEFMIKAVDAGRATTVPEAIDKYEEQLHRWKIEQANSQMVALQQQQTAHLSSIKKSSKISAAANVTNTLFNIASKL